MDMNVDTATLDELLWKLESNKNEMYYVARDFGNYVNKAGKNWQGNLYDTASEVMLASGKSIETTMQNIEKVRDYIGRLQKHVEQYLSCQYDG